MQFIAMAKRQGGDAKVHFIDTPRDVLRARIEQRNASLPRFNFTIDPAMLDVFFDLFEVPSEDEGAPVIVVRDPRAEEANLSDRQG
jgi:hypothetical protein